LAALQGKKHQVEAIVFDLPQICRGRGSVAHEQGAQVPSVCPCKVPEVVSLRHATACHVRYRRSSERADQRLATIRQINRCARDIAFHGLAGWRRIGRKRQRETVALDGAINSLLGRRGGCPNCAGRCSDADENRDDRKDETAGN
jgi:hypothetical protein